MVEFKGNFISKKEIQGKLTSYHEHKYQALNILRLFGKLENFKNQAGPVLVGQWFLVYLEKMNKKMFRC